MTLTKGERREDKRRKGRYGHKVRGRSLLTVQQVIRRKAEKARTEDN